MVAPALFNEKYADAIRYTERSLALDSGNIYAYYDLAQIYNILGENEKSVLNYKKFIANLDDVMTVGLRNRHRVGIAYLVTGQQAKAEEYFELQKKYCEESIELDRRYAQDITAYYDLACVYSISGDKSNAYKNLNIYNNKIGENEIKAMVWYFKTDPFFDNIRNEPEFQAIYHEIEIKYNNTHKKVRKWLEEKNML